MKRPLRVDKTSFHVQGRFHMLVVRARPHIIGMQHNFRLVSRVQDVALHIIHGPTASECVRLGVPSPALKSRSYARCTRADHGDRDSVQKARAARPATRTWNLDSVATPSQAGRGINKLSLTGRLRSAPPSGPGRPAPGEFDRHLQTESFQYCEKMCKMCQYWNDYSICTI